MGQTTMKLTLEPQPDGYTADKAVILTDETGEMVLIGCQRASIVGEEIARVVNMHDALVAALEPFQSHRMGKLIKECIVASMREDQRPETETQIGRMIDAVDLILRAGKESA